MQTSLTYRTNRDLFSNHYLDEHLPETEAWDEVSDAELEAAREEILELWEREKGTAPDRNEAQLEANFIRPMFRELGIPFEVEESTSRTQRRPDYGFFESDEAARSAFDRRNEGGDFYENAVAVADAKRWGRPLDTRGSGEHRRDFENPSYQIHVYLQETPTRWAVLTDGKKWRLYYGPTSHRLDSYYEVDLPTILEQGDLGDFKYFYLFFRHEAFVEDATGDCFLDDVHEESNVFAEELGEDLQENIYEAIRVLSEGFLQYSGNDLDEEDLDIVHDSSLIYLYRIIFVLYAEAEGRDLLDTDNRIYEENYSINTLKQEVAEELDSDNPGYRDWQTSIADRLDELFQLIDQGSTAQNIPEEDLYIPAYNGGLFRTDPDEDDSPESRFLATHEVGDAHLARVIDLLTRSANAGNGTTGEGKIFADYSSLDVRHLGSIYEGLLEYQLHVADEDLAVNDDGEYVPAGADDANAGEVVVEEGDIYLTTDSGERKATGSYYTPEYVVEYIVENTLGPLVEDIRKDLAGKTAHGEGGFAGDFADRIFELKILDPAMGSGHFLTSAVDYLAREIIDAQEKQAAQEGIETVEEERDINWARRQVAQRCIYGVDLNPLAVELAKVSLWLRTLAAEQPLAFLDHHLKTGNSLVGSDIETVLDNGDPDNGTDEGQLTLQQSFAHTRQQALEHVTDQFEDLLAIDNETLDDIKEMEAVYEEVRTDPLYQHLIAMANVHTAEQFGLDVPEDADERMAEALRDDSWEAIEGQDWYKSAQAMAEEQRFFHWELEFPIAFYEQDGVWKDDGGFDAVIGNPPYVRIYNDTLPENYVEYLRGSYDTAYMKFDLYVVFTQVGIRLCRKQGFFSYIIPDKFISTPYGEPLRELMLSKTKIESILDLRDREVFKDVTVSNLVPVLQKSNGQNDRLEVRTLTTQNTVVAEELSMEGVIVQDDSSIRLSRSVEDMRLTIKIKDKSISFDEVFYVNWGLRTGTAEKTDKYVVEKSNDPKAKPMIRGSNIVDSYRLEPPSEYIIYEKRDLYNPMFEELFESDKIIFRKISGRGLMAVADEDGKYCFSTLIPCVNIQDVVSVNRNGIPESTRKSTSYDNLYYPLAVVNSSLLEWFHKVNLSDELSVVPNHINKLPIAEISQIDSQPDQGLLSDVIESIEDIVEGVEETDKPHIDTYVEENDKIVHDVLARLAKWMTEFNNEYMSLNLSLLDYLGIPSDGLPDSKAGDTLEEMQMPVAGVADTPLAKTTEDYEGLRIEGVSFAEDGGRVVLSVDVSYKVGEDDPRETDRWDRLAASEFETYEAMAFVGLSEAQQTLLREFVPVAVEEAGGFAGFRDNATKTITPLDRLKALTLPDIDAVEAGLEQYVEVRERADELERKIEKTDELIDEIVYDLYGLTDEEIEIVEEAVGD